MSELKLKRFVLRNHAQVVLVQPTPYSRHNPLLNYVWQPETAKNNKPS